MDVAEESQARASLKAPHLRTLPTRVQTASAKRLHSVNCWSRVEGMTQEGSKRLPLPHQEMFQPQRSPTGCPQITNKSTLFDKWSVFGCRLCRGFLQTNTNQVYFFKKVPQLLAPPCYLTLEHLASRCKR